MTYNPNYAKGAIWKTRTNILANLDIDPEYEDNYDEKIITIPKGQIVLLLSYYMSSNFVENIRILWNKNIYICYSIDTAYEFRTDLAYCNKRK